MDCAHLIHPRKYNIHESKFVRDAFANNRGSLSIVDVACAENKERTICNYLRKSFRGMDRICSDPPVFWRFDTDSLAPGGTLTPDAVENNPCHCIITGLEDDQLWATFEGVQISDLQICDNGSDRALTLNDVNSITEAFKAKNKKSKTGG